jgi:hypothetical protein
MSPGRIRRARRSIITRPAVQTESAARKLASSMRRLGADEATVSKLTGQRPVRPATR